MPDALLIFAKNAVYGEVKTRLAADIGKQGALEIYKQLLEYTASVTSQVAVAKYVFYSSTIGPDDYWSNKFTKKVQAGEDLGERMKNAFRTLRDEGYTKLVIIGTDCFEVTTEIINNAFRLLENNDIVIGPATDGGYYLLGLKKLYDELFMDIAWSTGRVFEQTLSACDKLGVSVSILPVLTDVDTIHDLTATQRTTDSTNASKTS